MFRVKLFSLALLAVSLMASTSHAQILRRVFQSCDGNGNCQSQSQVESSAMYDTDGARIISFGPVGSSILQPTPAPLAEIAQAPTLAGSIGAVGAPAKATARDFRQALLKAARQERGASLTLGGYWDIFVGSLNPQKLELAKLAVFDSGVQDGVIPASASIGAIDWERLIELIIKYLPQILDLFTSQPQAQAQGITLPITMSNSFSFDFSTAA